MCLAIPAQIKHFVDEQRHFATVEVSGVQRDINIDLVREDGIEVDDWVLIHVGFAMSKVSEQEAKEQIQFLSLLGEAGAADEEVAGYRFDALLERPEARDTAQASDATPTDAVGDASDDEALVS